ncbi:short coiled-coil protein B-like [Dendronephthya gigantea]|uniref:short coiled-coil protein B-like n=1 Tax=Dendronephthya gigantea TaxID=151771 RepID=UPI00106D64D9|nr:short coiled-coil protein B-like [Dendronephthya gigantea]
MSMEDFNPRVDEKNLQTINLSSSDDESGACGSAESTLNDKPLDSSVVIDDDEGEEKAKLINEVLELQNTLDDLSQRVDAVKDENLKLKSENQVLGQYIENLMSASSVFQATNAPTKKRQVPSRPIRKK